MGTRGQSEVRDKCRKVSLMYMCFGKRVFRLFMYILIYKVLLVHRREFKIKLTVFEKNKKISEMMNRSSLKAI